MKKKQDIDWYARKVNGNEITFSVFLVSKYFNNNVKPIEEIIRNFFGNISGFSWRKEDESINNTMVFVFSFNGLDYELLLMDQAYHISFEDDFPGSFCNGELGRWGLVIEKNDEVLFEGRSSWVHLLSNNSVDRLTCELVNLLNKSS